MENTPLGPLKRFYRSITRNYHDLDKDAELDEDRRTAPIYLSDQEALDKDWDYKDLYFGNLVAMIGCLASSAFHLW
ncbi:hypothetical protein ElyMa_000131400 [Elysia marginata]|uniref:Uncharacterized protein n=1 Tax=Elysia marginata TaxID=1093978 RepID=A0AAV4EP79_9GAST|nr:hypothetical protein ElyMa_000131400 [Elysia marginata]